MKEIIEKKLKEIKEKKAKVGEKLIFTKGANIAMGIASTLFGAISLASNPLLGIGYIAVGASSAYSYLKMKEREQSELDSLNKEEEHLNSISKNGGISNDEASIKNRNSKIDSQKKELKDVKSTLDTSDKLKDIHSAGLGASILGLSFFGSPILFGLTGAFAVMRFMAERNSTKLKSEVDSINTKIKNLENDSEIAKTIVSTKKDDKEKSKTEEKEKSNVKEKEKKAAEVKAEAKKTEKQDNVKSIVPGQDKAKDETKHTIPIQDNIGQTVLRQNNSQNQQPFVNQGTRKVKPNYNQQQSFTTQGYDRPSYSEQQILKLRESLKTQGYDRPSYNQQQSFANQGYGRLNNSQQPVVIPFNDRRVKSKDQGQQLFDIPDFPGIVKPSLDNSRMVSDYIDGFDGMDSFTMVRREYAYRMRGLEDCASEEFDKLSYCLYTGIIRKSQYYYGVAEVYAQLERRASELQYEYFKTVRQLQRELYRTEEKNNNPYVYSNPLRNPHKTMKYAA